MSTPALEALIGAWLDGTIAPAELAELDRRLVADPAAARRFAACARVHADLRLAERRARHAPAEGATLSARLASALSQVPAAPPPRRRSPIAPRSGARRWRWAGPALALAALVMVAVALVVRRGAVRAPDVARLEEAIGCTLVGARAAGDHAVDGARRADDALRAGDLLHPGDGLRVAVDGRASLAWPDGTRVALDPGSELALVSAPGKRLVVNVGGIAAEVAPQPASAPLVVAAAGGELTVVGTRFTARVDGDQLALRVDEGRVRARRAGDGAEAQVAAGESLLLAPGSPMDVARGAAEAGRVRVLRYSDARFADWLPAGAPGDEAWMHRRLWRCTAFSPWFDARAARLPGALMQVVAGGIAADDPRLAQHPGWALTDADGSPLWAVLPRDGSPGLRAADVSDAAWRAAWIADLRAQLAGGGWEGVWVGAVDLAPRLARADGGAAHPRIAADAWAEGVVRLLEELRAALPGRPIALDCVWFSGQGDAREARRDRAGDLVHFARGVGDPGLTGSDGAWSLAAFLAAVDRVHAHGRAVALEIAGDDPAAREYALSGALLVAEAGDAVGDGRVAPDAWWRGYDVDLGPPLGPRRPWHNGWRRDFAEGTVVLLGPDAPAILWQPPPGLMRLDGAPAAVIALGPRRAAILARPAR